MKKFKRITSAFLTIVILSTMCIQSAASVATTEEYQILSLKDARKILMYATEIEAFDYDEISYADINHDGYINTTDAYLALGVAAGIKRVKLHSYSDWSLQVAPTCTEDGYEYSECLVCGEAFYKNLPAKGHTPVGVTCTTEGYCSVCGQTVAPTGHNYVNSVCINCNPTTTPTVNVSGKNIPFGATKEVVINTLGKPTETLRDTTSYGDVVFYVYANDYKNLNIFTFLNNSFVEIYTNSAQTTLFEGEKSLYMNADKYYELTDTTYMPYVDYQHPSGEYEYAFTAVYGDWMYLIKDGSDNRVSEKLIFHSLNGCRAIHNVSPLKFCEKARTSAYKHSADMAENGYFDHTNLNGELPWDRMNKEGISWKYCGENIASGHISAYQMNNGWYNSQTGHRESMLEERFDYVGIGVTCSKNATNYDRTYGTENFYQSLT